MKTILFISFLSVVIGHIGHNSAHALGAGDLDGIISGTIDSDN